LEANINYTDPDANDGPSGTIGASSSIHYHFNQKISANFSVSGGDEEKTAGLNLRYRF